jgi:hypothetical protein
MGGTRAIALFAAIMAVGACSSFGADPSSSGGTGDGGGVDGGPDAITPGSDDGGKGDGSTTLGACTGALVFSTSFNALPALFLKGDGTGASLATDVFVSKPSALRATTSDKGPSYYVVSLPQDGDWCLAASFWAKYPGWPSPGTIDGPRIRNTNDSTLGITFQLSATGSYTVGDNGGSDISLVQTLDDAWKHVVVDLSRVGKTALTTMTVHIDGAPVATRVLEVDLGAGIEVHLGLAAWSQNTIGVLYLDDVDVVYAGH